MQNNMESTGSMENVVIEQGTWSSSNGIRGICCQVFYDDGQSDSTARRDTCATKGILSREREVGFLLLKPRIADTGVRKAHSVNIITYSLIIREGTNGAQKKSDACQPLLPIGDKTIVALVDFNANRAKKMFSPGVYDIFYVRK